MPDAFAPIELPKKKEQFFQHKTIVSYCIPVYIYNSIPYSFLFWPFRLAISTKKWSNWDHHHGASAKKAFRVCGSHSSTAMRPTQFTISEKLPPKKTAENMGTRKKLENPRDVSWWVPIGLNDPIFGFWFWIRVLWVNNKGLNDSMEANDSTHMDLMTQFLWVRFWIVATIGKWSKLWINKLLLGALVLFLSSHNIYIYI